MDGKTARISNFQRDSGLWAKPNEWPIDTPDYVFLARVCHALGRAIFGAQWIDPSWSIEEPEEFPDDCNDETSERYEETWERYDRACDEIQAALEQARVDVAQKIVGLCQQGKLVAALRRKAGGKMIEIGWELWNTENCLTRFNHCDMSLHAPFKPRAKRDWWIYISQKSLNQYLAELSNPGTFAITRNPVDVTDESIGCAAPLPGRLWATVLAIMSLWKGPPVGVMAEHRYKTVNDFLKKNGKSEVSRTTIQRALKWIRQNRDCI